MAKTIELTFGGESRPFRLAIGELRELQGKCNAGPATVLARLMSFQPQATDIKRPRPDDFPLGIRDPDFVAQFNLFATMRSIGGDWRVDDIRETIRLGLIGGGMSQTDAYILISQYVEERPWAENIGTAVEILAHAISGEPDDPVGKTQAGKTNRQAMDA